MEGFQTKQRMLDPKIIKRIAKKCFLWLVSEKQLVSKFTQSQNGPTSSETTTLSLCQELHMLSDKADEKWPH